MSVQIFYIGHWGIFTQVNRIDKYRIYEYTKARKQNSYTAKQQKEVICMATSSILKEFYIKDAERYEWLKRELEKGPIQKSAKESASLKKGREKLATFVFR